MVFGNGVKNIQAAAYNGARTVVLLGADILVFRLVFSWAGFQFFICIQLAISMPK